jgi:hypothetical protein
MSSLAQGTVVLRGSEGDSKPFNELSGANPSMTPFCQRSPLTKMTAYPHLTSVCLMLL